MPLDRSDVHVDRALTDFALGILDDLQYASDALMPYADVSRETDKFFKFDIPSRRRVPDALRAMGTRSRETDFIVSTAAFSCEEYALHEVLPDRLDAHQDEVLALREEMTADLEMKLMLLREIRVKDLATTPTNYPAAHRLTGGADWDTIATITKDEVNTAKTLIRRAIGARPNLMIIQDDILQALENNTDVIERIKYTQTALNTDLNEALLAKYYGIAKVLNADQVYESAKEGATASPADVWPDDVIVCIANPNPTRRTRHFATTFATRRTRVKRWREEGVEGDVIEASGIMDENIVDSSCGVHIDNVLS